MGGLFLLMFVIIIVLLFIIIILSNNNNNLKELGCIWNVFLEIWLWINVLIG